jgi:hypothetical protein
MIEAVITPIKIIDSITLDQIVGKKDISSYQVAT